jgi:hypothetical protein
MVAPVASIKVALRMTTGGAPAVGARDAGPAAGSLTTEAAGRSATDCRASHGGGGKTGAVGALGVAIGGAVAEQLQQAAARRKGIRKKDRWWTVWFMVAAA